MLVCFLLVYLYFVCVIFICFLFDNLQKMLLYTLIYN